MEKTSPLLSSIHLSPIPSFRPIQLLPGAFSMLPALPDAQEFQGMKRKRTTKEMTLIRKYSKKKAKLLLCLSTLPIYQQTAQEKKSV